MINQVGKRGTNEWEFGGQVLWEPDSLREEYKNLYLPDSALPAGYEYEDPDMAGALYSRGKGAGQETTTYSAYVGGPIVQDRLFFFLAGEARKIDSTANANALSTGRTSARSRATVE